MYEKSRGNNYRQIFIDYFSKNKNTFAGNIKGQQLIYY